MEAFLIPDPRQSPNPRFGRSHNPLGTKCLMDPVGLVRSPEGVNAQVTSFVVSLSCRRLVENARLLLRAGATVDPGVPWNQF